MVTARERLRQLSIAQEGFEQEAESVRVAPPYSLPRGGAILTRPVRPSAAEGLQPEDPTPFSDFGEFFLNQLGISSERQRLARTETLAAIHSANQTIGLALEDQANAIEARGVGGFDAELLKNARIQQAKAIELLDNPDPNIQEYGRAMAQSIAATYDQINKDHNARLGTVRDQVTSRLNGLVDLGRAEASANDSVISQLNEYGKRNGINQKLPALLKQAVADYLGGTPFSQRGQETRGMFENLPGFNVAFDPTEEITVGNASALIAAVKQEREKSVAGSLAKEMETATRAGFRLIDDDGRLTAEELPVSTLEKDISRLIFNMPAGERFSIQPGLPSKEDAARTAQSNMDIASSTGGQFANAIGEFTGFNEARRNFQKGLSILGVDGVVSEFRKFDKNFTDEVRKFFAPDQVKPLRPTND